LYARRPAAASGAQPAFRQRDDDGYIVARNLHGGHALWLGGEVEWGDRLGLYWWKKQTPVKDSLMAAGVTVRLKQH
jgi:hypothetical protein